MPQSRTIGLMGGSFNPPHKGHAALAQWALQAQMPEWGKLDELWWIPSFRHPWGKELWPWEHRLAMLDLCLKELNEPRMKVCTIERDANLNPAYTIDVVSALERAHSETSWVWVLGEDAASDRHLWHRIDDLNSKVAWLVAPRVAEDRGPLPPWSSRQIRDLIKRHKDISPMVGNTVAAYIGQHHLGL